MTSDALISKIEFGADKLQIMDHLKIASRLNSSLYLTKFRMIKLQQTINDSKKIHKHWSDAADDDGMKIWLKASFVSVIFPRFKLKCNFRNCLGIEH